VSKEVEKLIQWRKDNLDTKSASFCGAKWYNATTWLGSGTTASCHHPPAHKIPLVELEGNPSAIHNTKHKKAMRKMMQEGDRPRECEYCWKMEDIPGDKNPSDRIFKSNIYTPEQLDLAYNADFNDNTNLKTFEIAFDRVCNLACSYCNASFSTTWAKDINKDGPYQNLVSDGAAAFQQDGDWTEPFGRGAVTPETNPYIKAFWDWWESGLADELEELRVTGGEPLMSGETWKLFDKIKARPEMRLAINSNLICKDSLLTTLIEKSQDIKKFHIYTSAECYKEQQEYVRDNFVWKTWNKNMNRIINEANYEGLHIMMTINSLCLFSITEFLDHVYTLKLIKNTKSPTVTLNLLRFPSFQSPLALPDHIKIYVRKKLQDWYATQDNKGLWTGIERGNIERLIDYLDHVDAPHRRTSSKTSMWRDFKSFYEQYDIRRGHDIHVFPEILTDWLDAMPPTITNVATLTEGDSTKDNVGDVDLNRIAKEEGWILEPDNKNIDEPLGDYDE
jgi:organic radical activating enzyme